MMIKFAISAVCLALFMAASGCDRPGRDVAELRDPLVRQAHMRLREGDKQGALAALNRALVRKPELAQAHLDAALLYDDYKKDYVRAIYHYTRYLEIQPDVQKRDMIEGLIRSARMAYAAQLADQELMRDHRVKQLREENARLQSDLRELRANLAQVRMAAAGVKAAPASAAAPTTAPSSVPSAPRPIAPAPSVPAPPSAADATYEVQPRDTLSVIAAKLYQDPRKWPLLYEANRDILPGPEKLSVGMKLKIPSVPRAAE